MFWKLQLRVVAIHTCRSAARLSLSSLPNSLPGLQQPLCGSEWVHRGARCRCGGDRKCLRTSARAAQTLKAHQTVRARPRTAPQARVAHSPVLSARGCASPSAARTCRSHVATPSDSSLMRCRRETNSLRASLFITALVLQYCRRSGSIRACCSCGSDSSRNRTPRSRRTRGLAIALSTGRAGSEADSTLGDSEPLAASRSRSAAGRAAFKAHYRGVGDESSELGVPLMPLHLHSEERMSVNAASHADSAADLRDAV